MNPRGFTPRLKTMLTPKAGVQTEKIDGCRSVYAEHRNALSLTKSRVWF